MKIKELLEYGRNNLIKKEEPYRLSKILLKYLLKVEESYLIINQDETVNTKTEEEYKKLIELLNKGIPIQYITHHQEFMRMNFYVDENVLIPQPDTEILVEEVIGIAKRSNKELNVLDMCTGSGCIAVAIAKNLENSNVVMSDISKKALEIAEKNYNQNIENGKKAKFVESNMFEKIEGKFDIIVSNPPYIESQNIENLSNEVKREPHIALDGGKDGLDFYRILISESYKYLNENGYLCMEIGYNQKVPVMRLIEESGKYKETYCKEDLAGNDRVIITRT